MKSCVLNSELPSNIRCHAVSQFNSGVYDIIIASDERSLEEPIKTNKKLTKKELKKSKKKRNEDKEFDLSRGIDFQCVSNVINFDFPLNINSYIHRAGRTARGNNTGSVLSFVSFGELEQLNKTEEHLKDSYGTEDDVFKKYEFKLEEIEAFRYRSDDAWRVITKEVIKQSRLKEIKIEMFNSEKLKSHFEHNPKELQVLRHDKPLSVLKVKPHLIDVPEYIVPDGLKSIANIERLRKRKSKNLENPESKAAYEEKLNNPLLCAGVDFSKKKRYWHK